MPGIQTKIKIGDVYNRLCVIDTPIKMNKRWYVHCICLCPDHYIKLVRIDSLVSDKIKSCGCLAKENGYKQGKNSKNPNTYDLSNDFGIGYTKNYNNYGENWFYFDLEDFDKISKYTWCFDRDGYLMTMRNRHQIKMHRLVTDCPKNLEVDHIYYTEDNRNTRNDNRKSNLKVCTHKENCHNRIDKGTGAIQTKYGRKVYKKYKYIGTYDDTCGDDVKSYQL